MSHTFLDLQRAIQTKLLQCPSGRRRNCFKPQKCRQTFVNYTIQILTES